MTLKQPTTNCDSLIHTHNRSYQVNRYIIGYISFESRSHRASRQNRAICRFPNIDLIAAFGFHIVQIGCGSVHEWNPSTAVGIDMASLRHGPGAVRLGPPDNRYTVAQHKIIAPELLHNGGQGWVGSVIGFGRIIGKVGKAVTISRPGLRCFETRPQLTPKLFTRLFQGRFMEQVFQDYIAMCFEKGNLLIGQWRGCRHCGAFGELVESWCSADTQRVLRGLLIC